MNPRRDWVIHVKPFKNIQIASFEWQKMPRHTDHLQDGRRFYNTSQCCRMSEMRWTSASPRLRFTNKRLLYMLWLFPLSSFLLQLPSSYTHLPVWKSRLFWILFCSVFANIFPGNDQKPTHTELFYKKHFKVLCSLKWFLQEFSFNEGERWIHIWLVWLSEVWR